MDLPFLARRFFAWSARVSIRSAREFYVGIHRSDSRSTKGKWPPLLGTAIQAKSSWHELRYRTSSRPIARTKLRCQSASFFPSAFSAIAASSAVRLRIWILLQVSTQASPYLLRRFCLVPQALSCWL